MKPDSRNKACGNTFPSSSLLFLLRMLLIFCSAGCTNNYKHWKSWFTDPICPHSAALCTSAFSRARHKLHMRYIKIGRSAILYGPLLSHFILSVCIGCMYEIQAAHTEGVVYYRWFPIAYRIYANTPLQLLFVILNEVTRKCNGYGVWRWSNDVIIDHLSSVLRDLAVGQCLPQRTLWFQAWVTATIPSARWTLLTFR